MLHGLCAFLQLLTALHFVVFGGAHHWVGDRRRGAQTPMQRVKYN